MPRRIRRRIRMHVSGGAGEIIFFTECIFFGSMSCHCHVFIFIVPPCYDNVIIIWKSMY